MKAQLQLRLKSLQAEYESGEKLLNELAAKAAETKQAMLRISGAIQVLEEELAIYEKAPVEPELKN
jgi:hypothetical protein